MFCPVGSVLCLETGVGRESTEVQPGAELALCRTHCEGPEFPVILPAGPTGSAGSQQTASRAEGNVVREGVRTLLSLC